MIEGKTAPVNGFPGGIGLEMATALTGAHANVVPDGGFGDAADRGGKGQKIAAMFQAPGFASLSKSTFATLQGGRTAQ